MFKHQSKGDGSLAKDVDLNSAWQTAVSEVHDRFDELEPVSGR